MGNCLVLHEKIVKVMKPDGKILEYRAPIKVQQVLSDFCGHAISESLEALRHLLPDTKLLGGNLYYLVPLPPPTPKSKKKVRFSIPGEEDGQGTNVVRIKLVISKRELQEMLQKGGVSVEDMVSKLQDQQRVDHNVNVQNSDHNHNGWEPVLESIPEMKCNAQDAPLPLSKMEGTSYG